MIGCYCAYRTKPGMRAELVRRIEETKLAELFCAQKGNLYYHISLSITDEDVLIFNDGWADKKAFDAHVASEDCKIWFDLDKQYIEKSEPYTYEL